MGLVERLFGRGWAIDTTAPVGRAGAPATTTAPPNVAGPLPIPYLDGRSAVALSAVWRCVDLISSIIADWPWTEWRGEGDDAVELAASRLVRRPLVAMTRREWTWRVVATEALFSTAHLLHVGGSDSEGAPWSLLPIPPNALSPASFSDPWYVLPPTRYIVMGQQVDARYVTCVRRFPFPGVPDWLNGVINLARTQFTSYLAADAAASRYWRAGGPVTTVITTDQELDAPAAEAIAQRWVDRRSLGADYPAVLGKGAHAEPWGADPTAEASVDARREINADVGRYFGVPTRILNAPAGDSETYANVENDAIDLHRYTLRGYAGPIEDAISELLPGDYINGRRMRLDPTAYLQGDLASRAKAWPLLVASGIVDQDEARRKGFGLPPRGGGNVMAPAMPPAVPASLAGISATVYAQEAPNG